MESAKKIAVVFSPHWWRALPIRMWGRDDPSETLRAGRRSSASSGRNRLQKTTPCLDSFLCFFLVSHPMFVLLSKPHSTRNLVSSQYEDGAKKAFPHRSSSSAGPTARPGLARSGSLGARTPGLLHETPLQLSPANTTAFEISPNFHHGCP